MLNLLNAYYVAGLEIPKKCLLVPFVICALWLVNCKVLKKDQKAREEQNFTFSAFIRDVHDFKIEKKEREMNIDIYWYNESKIIESILKMIFFNP